MSKTRPEFKYEKGPKFPRQHPPIQNPAYGPDMFICMYVFLHLVKTIC